MQELYIKIYLLQFFLDSVKVKYLVKAKIICYHNISTKINIKNTMNFSELTWQKTQARDTNKSTYNFPRRSKILVGIHFTQTKMTQKILSGLAILPANFIIFWDIDKQVDAKNIAYKKSHEDFDMVGIDAMLCDCDDIKLEKIMEIWVVPIVNEKNYLGKILSEFHPGRAEGNAYLYEDDSYWSAYYALIRYLENHKFPYDNRNLVKNVVWV